MLAARPERSPSWEDIVMKEPFPEVTPPLITHRPVHNVILVMFGKKEVRR